MKETRHMCIDIRGFLNFYRNKSMAYLMTDEKTGRYLTSKQAREYLEDCLANGWRVLPLGDCDNFDHMTGCKGHPVKE